MKKPKFKYFSPDQIRQMRLVLKKTRDEFGEYFFVSGHTVKGWEIGRREPCPPAFFILQMIDDEVREKRAAHGRIRRKLQDSSPAV